MPVKVKGQCLLVRLLERVSRFADRAPELVGAVGLAALAVAVLADGFLSILASVVAVLAAVALAVLPRLLELAREIRARVVIWILSRT